MLYTSDQSHMSIEKGAIAVGVGQKNIRKVPSDAEFRMRADALAKMVEEDKRAGKRPFCVVATVGTTSTTSIDPVPQIADIAEKHGLWLHVDCAYAGAAAILPEQRHIMAGVERAHSLVFNAHKWLLTPIDLSAFYTRRPDILRRAFSLTPDYLKTQDDPRAHNLMDYGVPLGHRFRALKLWFVMRYFGRERIEAMLRSHIQWAKDFAALVDAHPKFERVAPVPLSVVCFRYKGSDDENRAIMEKVNASGSMFIASTVLNGKSDAAAGDWASGNRVERRAGSVGFAAKSGGRALTTKHTKERREMFRDFCIHSADKAEICCDSQARIEIAQNSFG